MPSDLKLALGHGRSGVNAVWVQPWQCRVRALRRVGLSHNHDRMKTSLRWILLRLYTAWNQLLTTPFQCCQRRNQSEARGEHSGTILALLITAVA